MHFIYAAVSAALSHTAVASLIPATVELEARVIFPPKHTPPVMENSSELTITLLCVSPGTVDLRLLKLDGTGIRRCFE
ncbi:hypothetical protein C8F04DRAFT_1248313 [Mycena alexandri]|uniref:Secreted protein n=1 Tax=Mycena alexandri TaxID=1745969 RepID=A0AAD6TIQ6_9AGAR|nr:hypothetical protein C8F04DRAFT_1248313 [Mycena alexandri]